MDKTAFLFTGQGAQYAGMGKDLYERYGAFKNIFEAAGAYLNVNILDICGDAEKLAKTDAAQAAIFALSYGICELLKERGIRPFCAAGFSLGEITSLAAAGVVSLTDALGLIRARGAAMQSACERKPGAMYSVIGAEDAAVEQICADTGGYVVPANYNCPGQIVISGETAAVEAAVKTFAEKKYRTIKLNVAGAFHSELMRYDLTPLTAFLETIEYNPPKFDLYSNLTGEKFDFGGDIKSYMTDYIPKQMAGPVRFREELRNMADAGCSAFIEIGAGRVLAGFVKRTCEGAAAVSVSDAESLEAALRI